MSLISASTNVDTIKNIALGLSAGSIVLALIAMKVISSVVGKIVSLVVFVAIALAGYSQRASIIDCASKVQVQATATASVNTQCTFFGRIIDVKVPQRSK